MRTPTSLLLASGCLLACARAPTELLEPQTPQLESITAATFARLDPHERLMIDTRDAQRVFKFDYASGSIPFERITLICPNDVPMAMDDWLADQSQRSGVDFRQAPSCAFTVGQMDPNDADAAPFGEECPETCWRCADGLLICISTCVETCEPNPPGPPPPEVSAPATSAAQPADPRQSGRSGDESSGTGGDGRNGGDYAEPSGSTGNGSSTGGTGGGSWTNPGGGR